MSKLLSSVINNEAREYALYTVENRAIPNVIDGFKPVQRFFMHSALQMCKNNKWQKVAAVGGRVSEYGYHHGEAAAAEAGQLVANTWNNNIQVLEGDGNFGSRLVQEAAAPRYTFCRPSTEFFNIFKDFDCCPAHKDLEHIPPRFYLPVIPMVLANGVKGIATGYATHIFPHSKESLVECTRLALTGKLDKDPEVKYPEFTGTISKGEDGQILIKGSYELTGKTKLTINEVPVKFDRESYIKVLDDAETQGKIVNYTDRCGEDGFCFEVTLKRDYFLGESEHERHSKIVKDFKLIQKASQNITVIDENGNLKVFECTKDLVNHFVKVRLGYVQNRIEYMIKQTSEKKDLAEAKANFITEVLAGNIVAGRGVSKKQLLNQIEAYLAFAPYSTQLINMNIYHMTDDEVVKLEKEAEKAKKENDYWCKTTPQKEFLKDLKQMG